MRKILLASTLLFPLNAQAQMIGSFADGSALTKLTAAAGGKQLPLQGVYVDSREQFSGFVNSAQWGAGDMVKTCPPSSCNPLLGLPMAGEGQNADDAFKAITNGSQDNMIKGVLQAFADKGYQNIILRPGFEMNGGWFSWSVTEANAADFKAAFQRIADIAHSFQDAIVSVNFNPNSGRSIPLQNYYPGNKYVDSIGIDIYGEPWQSDSAPNAADGSPTNLTFKYLAQFAKDNGLPFSIPETGSRSSDTEFPKQLTAAIKASGVPVWFAGLWNNDGVPVEGGAVWTNNAAATAAWTEVAALIQQSKAPASVWQAVQDLVSDAQAVFDKAQQAADIPISKALTIDETAALAAMPDYTSLTTSVRAASAKQDGPSGNYTPPEVPAGASTELTISSDFDVLVNTSGAHSIAVSGNGGIVVANGGPETIEVTGHGNAIRTGLFNDTITLHSSGNTIDGGGGEDTIILDLPTTNEQSPIIAVAVAGLAKAGNTIVAPSPGQGVLTIKGKLGADDSINVTKALASTQWDGTLATMNKYLSTEKTKNGLSLSINGKTVLQLTRTPTGGIDKYLTAGADL